MDNNSQKLNVEDNPTRQCKYTVDEQMMKTKFFQTQLIRKEQIQVAEGNKTVQVKQHEHHSKCTFVLCILISEKYK